MKVPAKIRPMANYMLVTYDKYTDEDAAQDGCYKQNVGSLKDYQKVIAVGPTVRGINVGDTVAVNPSRYGVRKHDKGSLKDGVITDNPYTHYNLPVLTFGEDSYLYITDQDVDFVIEEWKEVEVKKVNIITPSNKIIL